jgi:hypothetical protein
VLPGSSSLRLQFDGRLNVPAMRPGSSSSLQVLEFIRVRPRLVGAGSVGDRGGDASKLLGVALDVRVGGDGKCPIEREGRRLAV